MKHGKRMIFLVTMITLISLLMPCFASAESSNKVTASTSASVRQGNSGYCEVYIDSLENLASLNVEVYFDPDKVRMEDTYTLVNCSLYDSSVSDGRLQYSYIFDGNGEASKTQLFYFYYTVLPTADKGDTYFDIVVTDAFDATLNPLDVGGSRCSFEIAEAAVNPYCSIYGTSSISTMVKEEFELSYQVSTYDIAGGSFIINYDAELFEVVDVKNESFFDGKVTDVNTDLLGAVYISFAGTEYNYNCDLLKVKFRTIKNTATTSDIKLTVTEFCDFELNNYICMGHTTKVDIAHDPTYTEDAPSMTLAPSYDASTGKVTAVIKLDKDSLLGAGDFTVNFDEGKLTYISAEKGFAPSFFNINDKNVALGEFKFSIISLNDIDDEQTILTLVFDAKASCENYESGFELIGNGLSDSMTNSIVLNFVSSPVTVETSGHSGTGKWLYDSDAHWQICSRCGENTNGVAHIYDNEGDKDCNICGREKYPQGDINGDGIFDYFDVTKLFAYYRGKTTLGESVDVDVNGDGIFDYFDVTKLFAIYRGKASF